MPFGCQLAQAALTTTADTNVTTLVTTLVGPGITVVGTPTLVGSSTSSGTFTGGTDAGAGGIGIASGIILTSGNVANAMAPNNSPNAGGLASLLGDADLDALVGGGTDDTTSLTFKFTFGDGSVGGDLFFSYVFGSEEFNEYVNTSFNDVFAFFLDGVNIALIPSTSTAVSIDTVNNGVNSAYYRDNSAGGAGGTGGPYDTQYDGITTVLTASAMGLAAGEHTIKLAISDRADTAYDSGVFLAGGSFSTQPPGDTPEPASLLIWLGLGSIGVFSYRRHRKQLGVNS